MAREQRRLAAIIAADVVGYSLLMGRDESGTLARLRALRTDLIDPAIAGHGGRIVKTMGDGLLLEFPSAVDATQCAIEVQMAVAMRNADVPESERIVFRIGVNLGDIIIDGDDIHGDGVNVVARLEAEALAGGIVLAGAVHDAVTGRVKATFEDLGELSLKNIERPVRAYRVRVEGAALAPVAIPATSVSRPAAPLTEPSLAVLPFQNLGGDPEQAYFADGMMEEITTALSRIRSIFVIASASTQQYKDKPVSSQSVGRDLGVRYILEGSVRRAGNRVRIAVKLTDAADGSQLWAQHYEDTLDDVFALQDRVALSVAGIIEPTVQEVEIRRAARRPTSSTDAYDLYLKAMALVDSYEKDAMFEAVRLIDRALALDPNYARALSVAGYAHGQIVVSNWAADLAPHRKLALDYANRAVRLAPEDADSLSWNATTYIALDADYPLAQILLDRSLALNPGSYIAWMMSAFLRAAEGDPDTAVEHMQASMRLNPSSSDRGHQLSGLALARFGQRRFDEAVRLLKEAISLQPSVSFNLALLAACYGHLRDTKSAVGALEHYGRASTIDIDKRVSLFRRPDVRDLYLEGITLARRA